jgi:hypothetical protein
LLLLAGGNARPKPNLAFGDGVHACRDLTGHMPSPSRALNTCCSMG